MKDDILYSKREMDIMLGEIKDQLNRIEAQVMRTNGSVASLKMWRAYTTGAVAVLTTLVLPMAAYIAEQTFQLR